MVSLKEGGLRDLYSIISFKGMANCESLSYKDTY